MTKIPDWSAKAWPKDAVVVGPSGKLWRAAGDVAANAPAPQAPNWKPLASAGWEVIEVWEALSDGTKEFTADWTKYSRVPHRAALPRRGVRQDGGGLIMVGVQTSHKVGGERLPRRHGGRAPSGRSCPTTWMFEGAWRLTKNDVGLDCHDPHRGLREHPASALAGHCPLTGEFQVRWVGAGSGAILGLRR